MYNASMLEDIVLHTKSMYTEHYLIANNE